MRIIDYARALAVSIIFPIVALWMLICGAAFGAVRGFKCAVYDIKEALEND